ncbi:MAG: hypothetical protein AAF098_17860, partial [Pseudomonadota bacterium]
HSDLRRDVPAEGKAAQMDSFRACGHLVHRRMAKRQILLLRRFPRHSVGVAIARLVDREFSRDLKAYFETRNNPSKVLDLSALIRFNQQHAEQELAYFDQSIFLKAAALPDTQADYEQKRAATKKAMSTDGLDRLFAEHRLDALIGITTGPAWKIDWVNGDAFFGPSMAGPAAVAGNPHITLPLAEVDGLPLGISLIGQRQQDHRLAALAKLISDKHGAIDWRARIREELKQESD